MKICRVTNVLRFSLTHFDTLKMRTLTTFRVKSSILISSLFQTSHGALTRVMLILLSMSSFSLYSSFTLRHSIALLTMINWKSFSFPLTNVMYMLLNKFFSLPFLARWNKIKKNIWGKFIIIIVMIMVCRAMHNDNYYERARRSEKLVYHLAEWWKMKTLLFYSSDSVSLDALIWFFFQIQITKKFESAP